MPAFTPATQPAAVGPAGVTVAVPIPAGYRQRRIARLIVSHRSGSLARYSVNVSTDPAAADPLRNIVSYKTRGAFTGVDDDNRGNGFTWDGAETDDWSAAAKPVYVRIVPDTGADNNFTVAVYVDEGRS